MRFWVVLFFAVSLALSQVVYADVLSFKGSGQFFRADKKAGKFIYSDKLGQRSLDILPCNRDLIEKFWSDLLKNYRSTKLTGGASKLSKASVTYNDKKIGLLDFEDAYLFFKKVPNDILVIFSESKRLCQDE